MVHVGTSGFSYPEWRGTFYPKRCPTARMLPWYAARFHTVELNNTFYRMPTARAIAGWDQDTPAGFVFALKVPQQITHFARLRAVAKPLRVLPRHGRRARRQARSAPPPAAAELPEGCRPSARLPRAGASVRPHGGRVPPLLVVRRRGVRDPPRPERGPLRRRHRGRHHARRRDRGLRLPAPSRSRLQAGGARPGGRGPPRARSGATRSCTSSTRSRGPARRWRAALVRLLRAPRARLIDDRRSPFRPAAARRA